MSEENVKKGLKLLKNGMIEFSEHKENLDISRFRSYVSISLQIGGYKRSLTIMMLLMSYILF